MKDYGISSKSPELRLKAIRQLKPAPEAERKSFKIDDVKKGGFIQIEGTPYQVLGKYLYKEGKWIWYELQIISLKDGGITYLEWEVDDGIEFSLTTGKPKIREITDESGNKLNDEDIKTVLKDRDDLTFNGEVFEYDEKCKAKFFKEGDPEGEKVKMFDYESDNGNYLGIEEWEDEDGEKEYFAFTSKDVDPGDIEILMLG